MLNTTTLSKELNLPSPLELFTPPWEGAERVTMYVKRDDAIHPIISGNKWRKLKYALQQVPNNTSGIVSFGGGYSNHLHALGFVCAKLNIPFHAIIRGDYRQHPTPMIKDLTDIGASIHYVNKITYQRRNDVDYLQDLQAQFPNMVIIPEGGSQHAAIRGVQEMVQEIDLPFDSIIAPVASGATLAGIVSSLSPSQSAHGIGVLKGEGYLESLVLQFLPQQTNPFTIHHQFHCGGYAKIPTYLADFCEDFNQTMPFKIEGVYSGKVFWALKQMLAEHAFAPHQRIVIVHTGGIQGAR